jgi:hypothetical protein
LSFVVHDVCSVERFGGIDGNAALTSAAAVVLTALLLAEGVTIIDMGGLRTPHMLVGLVLIPPILVKLGSTGYRFARYYTRAPEYVSKGPPVIWLRLLAPVLVVTTIAIFVTGIALLAVGHKSDTVLELHKISFIVWGVVFGVHFLAHVAAMARSVFGDGRLAGAGMRLALVAGSVLAGVALALTLLHPITGWHGGHHHHHHD